MAVSKVDVGCCELTYKLQTFSETPSTNLKAPKPWFFGGKVQPLRQKQVPMGSHEEIEEDGNQDVWHAKISRFIRLINILERWTQPLFGGNGTCLQAHGSSVGPLPPFQTSPFLQVNVLQFSCMRGWSATWEMQVGFDIFWIVCPHPGCNRQIKVLVGIPYPKNVIILVVTIACILGGGSNWQLSPLTAIITFDFFC